LQRQARAVIALALIACTLSFVKFNHCQTSGWDTPDQYIHACYSDIPALFSGRSLDQGDWAYANGTDSVEYPVVTGVVMWALAKITPQSVSETQSFSATQNYFNINIIFLALLFLVASFIVNRIRPEFSYLFPLAPAAVLSLYINWDLWAIASMLGAIYWFDRKRLPLSAIALGISISTKFLPIFLLLPVIFIFYRRKQIQEGIKYFAITALTFLIINLPVFLTTPDAWLHFYKLNFDRGSDWGSLWYSLSALGINLANLNYLSILALLGGFLVVAIFLLDLKEVPSLASVSFIVLAIVMCVSKVYSPQYVLWLTPLAIIALIDKKDVSAFWVWQGAEVIYHFAIWQHLALVTGAKFGLPLGGYAILTLLRIGATLYLVYVFTRRGRLARSGGPDSQNLLREFLFESSAKYP
jgi:uncharacterized membrane protein